MDKLSGTAIGAVQREHRLQDDGIGYSDPLFSSLNPINICSRPGRMFRMIAQKVTKDDVGVEKTLSHLRAAAFDHILSNDFLGDLAQLFG